MEGTEVQLFSILTSALEGRECSISHPGHFLSWKETRCSLNREFGGPQTRSGRYVEQKNLVPSPGFEPPDRPALSLLTIPTTPWRILSLQRRLRQGIHIFSADCRFAAQKRITTWSADHTQRCVDWSFVSDRCGCGYGIVAIFSVAFAVTAFRRLLVLNVAHTELS